MCFVRTVFKRIKILTCKEVFAACGYWLHKLNSNSHARSILCSFNGILACWHYDATEQIQLAKCAFIRHIYRQNWRLYLEQMNGHFCVYSLNIFNTNLLFCNLRWKIKVQISWPLYNNGKKKDSEIKIYLILVGISYYWQGYWFV